MDSTSGVTAGLRPLDDGWRNPETGIKAPRLGIDPIPEEPRESRSRIGLEKLDDYTLLVVCRQVWGQQVTYG
jgi:hypothetical protein